jgi:predicted TIM-barrel fold metal-dependent hydrolase
MSSPLIIDADTHFTELPDLWTSRLPKSWGEDVMHVRWDEKSQADMWVARDKVIARAWGHLSYGLARANSEDERPALRSQVHVATWDQDERVKIMDQMGIRAAVLYPNIGGLVPSRMLGLLASRDIATAHVRAYNDGLLEWALNYPGRFIPMLVVPFWDIEASVHEIERNADKGFGGIVMTGAPYVHGSPFLADPVWDAMWAACVDAQMSVSFHVAGGGLHPLLGPEHEPLMAPATNLPYTSIPLMLANGNQVADVLLSGILLRFPTLKFASVESGMGWVPFVLETIDYFFKRARGDKQHPWGDVLPSDLFPGHVYVNAWFENFEPWHVEKIGADQVLFETDFPHRACLEAKDIDEAITTKFADVSQDVRDKILWKNGENLYKHALQTLEPTP